MPFSDLCQHTQGAYTYIHADKMLKHINKSKKVKTTRTKQNKTIGLQGGSVDSILELLGLRRIWPRAAFFPVMVLWTCEIIRAGASL